jgi:hypothetical protein
MVSSSSLMSLPLLLDGKLALLPSMRRCLQCCCNGNCCSCHNGVIAVVNAQACFSCCQANVVALAACHQAGAVTHIAMALLPSMRRVFCRCPNCNFHLNDNCIVANVNSQTSLPLLRRCHCSRTNGTVALDPQRCCCPHCNGIIAVLKLVALPCFSLH